MFNFLEIQIAKKMPDNDCHRYIILEGDVCGV